MSDNNPHIYLDNDLYLDLSRLVMINRGLPIYLSITQLQITRFLANHLNHPVMTDELIRHVWNSKVPNSELYKQINRIRNKMEPIPNQPKYLLTVRGCGYLLYSHANKLIK